MKFERTEILLAAMIGLALVLMIYLSISPVFTDAHAADTPLPTTTASSASSLTPGPGATPAPRAATPVAESQPTPQAAVVANQTPDTEPPCGK